ncbi:MAG: gamma-glutamyl-gamma-aminobutyrate hydrolase family protein [Lachnospiraceae bacterium]|nr:gamma-glutamyl-gamma-aminobutyrate hydrolase family protein [Lachnospiraceae bacterium]
MFKNTVIGHFLKRKAMTGAVVAATLTTALFASGCAMAPLYYYSTGTSVSPVENASGDVSDAAGTEAERDDVIGIAWRADTDSEFFTNICRAIEEAGGEWVLLDQVKSSDLVYDEEGHLTEGVDDTGALDEHAAKYVRLNTWDGSNAEEAVGNVGMVIFTGGEDISSSLYYTPEPWHGIEEEKDFNADRDVSDYLTMSYCLDKDIPLIGFCRGMQMLSVISGAEVIQDIPVYFKEQGLEYNYEHRNEKETPDSYRDYVPHEVQVEKDSHLYDIVQTDVLEGCPSWHHQAINKVDDTRLEVTGYTDTNGKKMIEAVERTDKTFAVGLQFHPEAAIVKNLDNAENKGDFLDYDSALNIFKYLVEEGFEEMDEAA